MAAAIIDFQRVTHQEVVVKVSGAGGDSGTITLNTDLFTHGQTAYGAGTIAAVASTTATLTGATWSLGIVGARLYRPDTKALLGTVVTRTNDTQVVLDTSITYSGTYGISYRSDELDGEVQTAPIVSAMYAGTSVITVTRDSVQVLTLNAAAANGKLDVGTLMGPDKQKDTKDITVAFVGASTYSQVWLKLRKVGGWKTRIETAYYGAHDDETVSGS